MGRIECCCGDEAERSNWDEILKTGNPKRAVKRAKRPGRRTGRIEGERLTRGKEETDVVMWFEEKEREAGTAVGELKQQRSQTGTTLSIRNGRKGVGGIATLGCTGCLGGRSWGHLGDSLGACWGGLGAGLVRLGASWRAWDGQSSPFSSGNCVCQEGAIPETETPRANDQEKAEGPANQQARRGPSAMLVFTRRTWAFPSSLPRSVR